jgi:lipopolysaccharide export system protein LptA
VRLIEATGQVKIEKADGRASSRKAVYNEDERTIVLTGDPVAWQHGTCVSGKKIVMFLDDDRTIVEGGSRVMIEPGAGGPTPAVCAK